VPFGVGVDPGSRERIAHSLDDEADLPAQKAPSREGARFPRPHADNRGPPRHRCSAGTWSEAADGLTDGRGKHPPRLVMLSRPQDFAALQGSGTSRSHPLFSARFLRTDLETTRFGLSTGRKLGGAVVRNRVRRRLREALRAMAPSFQPGWDVLIIVRPAIVDVGHEAWSALRRLAAWGISRGLGHVKSIDRFIRLSAAVLVAAGGLPLSRPACVTRSRRSNATGC
jgi:ribonuclease P protein component